MTYQTEWWNRMDRERPAAEAAADPTDSYNPSTPGVSDFNELTADLFADPDPEYDLLRRD